jgi:hypothetical protein
VKREPASISRAIARMSSYWGERAGAGGFAAPRRLEIGRFLILGRFRFPECEIPFVGHVCMAPDALQ